MYLISLHKSIFSSLLKDLLLLYVYLWAPASLVPPDARFRHWILRLGLDSCEPPCGCWSPNLDPLYEQQPFLTAEPSCHFLSPHKKVENTKVGNEARGVCASANEFVFSVREDGFYLAPSRWDLSRYKVNSWLPRNNAYSYFTSKLNRKQFALKPQLFLKWKIRVLCFASKTFCLKRAIARCSTLDSILGCESVWNLRKIKQGSA